MNKLTFKVKPKEQRNITSLIKEVNKISCRIYIDLENGVVMVEDVNDIMIDNVIELVDNYYSIIGVEIDNIIEEQVEQRRVPVAQEVAQVTATEVVTEETAEETTEGPVQKKPIVLEPQSEDDLIIKKVEFQNEYLESLLNKLLRTVSWAVYKQNVHEKKIGDYIYTCINEISMNYSPKEVILFSVGDIVDCNYGSHMQGEITGGHVHGIVCHIEKNMAYVVPITKITGDAISSTSYIEFSAPADVVYNEDKYNGGTALLDKGKYVRVERFNSVIGRTKSKFFIKLLCQLPSAFDFVTYFDEFVKEEAEETPEELVKTSDEQSILKRVGGVDEALMEAIGTAFDKLDKSNPIPEQVKTFMEDIRMSSAVGFLEQSFIVACDIKKINYENVILRLHNLNPNINEDIIKASLQEDFKRWLKQYPELAAKCPKISLISVLKVFAKKLS